MDTSHPCRVLAPLLARSPAFARRARSVLRGTSWLALFAAGGLSAPVAQRQFEEQLPKAYLPADGGWTEDLAAADLDGDGDVDLLAANGDGGRAHLYLNDGTGILGDVTATHLPASAVGLVAVGLADVEGDGDLDVFAGSDARPLFLYLNDGAGRFTGAPPGALPQPVAITLRDLVPADFDADGDTDLVAAPVGGAMRLRILLNDGLGAFVEETALRMPASVGPVEALAAGDADGDGVADLLLVTDGSEHLFLNDGAGFFNAPGAQVVVAGGGRSRDGAFVDVDGDLDLDIVVAHYGSRNALFLNDGSGNYASAPTSLPLGAFVSINDNTLSLEVGDVDGDGDADLLFGYLFTYSDTLLCLNDGQGVFSVAPLPSPVRDESYSLALADFDGDGDQDLCLGRRARNRIYLGGGDGGFTCATPGRFEWEDYWNGSSLAFLDADLDGDLDLWAGRGTFMTGLGTAKRLYENDGKGELSERVFTNLGGNNDVSAAIGDVDGDGDEDIVVGGATICPGFGGCMPRTNSLFRNTGSGFVDAVEALPADADDSFAVVLGDVDGDADLDVVFGNWKQQNRLYLNQGFGGFADATGTALPTGTDRTRGLALGDMDGDQDLDLLVANDGQQDRAFLNDGSGVFADVTGTNLPADLEASRAIAVGDADADGDLDVVIGRAGRTGLYQNDGTGVLTDASARIPSQLEETWALLFEDVDEDGDLDVLLGNQAPGGGDGLNRLMVNDGGGWFGDETALRMPDHLDPTVALALGDVDADGDRDLAVGNLFGGTPSHFTRLYMNLHRQLRAPRQPVLGRTYELELTSQPGYGAPAVAVAALGPGLRDVPLSDPVVGTLFLRGPLTILPAVTIPSGRGVARIEMPVPAQGSLLGTSFAGQGLVLDANGLRFTGFVVDAYVP